MHFSVLGVRDCIGEQTQQNAMTSRSTILGENWQLKTLC